ncbi:MAG TPA: hypothetical protein VEA80_10945 [Vitreimonas sp.]|uniref:hypothetical protein n=1 Tax=Vitreimonas sp. TaxID=3069702 RepID=UPI002D4C58BF|nr:hypothetical protein [Vitreimonas sp.]HYD87983.1 hypothetical protein [Vitreimonas sp.]
MSLNKTLDRLFDEIRREAKRNPDFADRLDAVLQRHDSRRDVPDDVLADVTNSSPASGGGAERSEAEGEVAQKAKRRAAPLSQPAAQPDSSPASGGAAKKPAPPAINPAGLYKKEGDDALTAALVALDAAALHALVSEHNLDPAGETAAMDEAELVAHIVAQAKRRAERDEKMFDY